MYQGERVAWYMLAMGQDIDLHTVHFHAESFLYRVSWKRGWVPQSALISIKKEENKKKHDNNQLKEERSCTWSIDQGILVWLCIPRSVIALQALAFPYDIEEMNGSFMW